MIATQQATSRTRVAPGLQDNKEIGLLEENFYSVMSFPQYDAIYGAMSLPLWNDYGGLRYNNYFSSRGRGQNRQRRETSSEGGFLSCEGPLDWLWIEVPIQGLYSQQIKSVNSRVFIYQDREWYFQCQMTANFQLELLLCPLDLVAPSISLLTVVQVWGYRHRKPDCSEVCESVQQRAYDGSISYVYLLWNRSMLDLDEIIPGISENYLLTFRIQFVEKNLQTGPILTDASVQTSLTASCISSMDSLSEDITKMIDVDLNPDVELRCDGNTTRSHGSLLSVRSPVLAKMLQSDMVEGRTRVINIRDMDELTFRLFMKHLHSGKLEQEELTFDVVLRLYEAGDMYQVQSLSHWCAQCLIQKLTVENACDALAVAYAHEDSDLEGKVTDFIVANEVVLADDLCEESPKLAVRVFKKMVSKKSQS